MSEFSSACVWIVSNAYVRILSSDLGSEFSDVAYVWIQQCLCLNPQIQLTSEFSSSCVWILRCSLCVNTHVQLVSKYSAVQCLRLNPQPWLMSEFSGLCLSCRVVSNVFPFWGWLYSCSYSRNQLMHIEWADISHFIYGSQQGQAEWTQCNNNVKHVINYRNTWKQGWSTCS